MTGLWERYGYIGSGCLDKIRVEVNRDPVGRPVYKDIATSEIVQMQHKLVALEGAVKSFTKLVDGLIVPIAKCGKCEACTSNADRVVDSPEYRELKKQLDC
jgi:hypothetical protein